MKLDAAIAQLRLYAPVFGGRVAGAADFDRGLRDQVWLDYPAAYVIPLDEEATPNASGPGLIQTVTERIGVIIALSNLDDRRGQAPAATYEEMRAAIFGAVLNWRPDANSQPRGYAYGGGQLRDFDRGRLFYQFEFIIETQITDDDGWHPPQTPLTQIDLVGTDPQDPARQLVEVRATGLNA